MIIVDTDVLIDVLRGHPPALQWLTSLGSIPLGIPGFVAMELIQGARNLEEQQRLEAFFSGYQLLWPDQATCSKAFESFARLYLSHGTGILDAMIGQIAVAGGGIIYTFNRKHYEAIEGLEVREPYVR